MKRSLQEFYTILKEEDDNSILIFWESNKDILCRKLLNSPEPIDKMLILNLIRGRLLVFIMQDLATHAVKIREKLTHLRTIHTITGANLRDKYGHVFDNTNQIYIYRIDQLAGETHNYKQSHPHYLDAAEQFLTWEDYQLLVDCDNKIIPNGTVVYLIELEKFYLLEPDEVIQVWPRNILALEQKKHFTPISPEKILDIETIEPIQPNVEKMVRKELGALTLKPMPEPTQESTVELSQKQPPIYPAIKKLDANLMGLIKNEVKNLDLESDTIHIIQVRKVKKNIQYYLQKEDGSEELQNRSLQQGFIFGKNKENKYDNLLVNVTVIFVKKHDGRNKYFVVNPDYTLTKVWQYGTFVGKDRKKISSKTKSKTHTNDYGSVPDFSLENPNTFLKFDWQQPLSNANENLLENLEPPSPQVTSQRQLPTKLEVEKFSYTPQNISTSHALDLLQKRGYTGLAISQIHIIQVREVNGKIRYYRIENGTEKYQPRTSQQLLVDINHRLLAGGTVIWVKDDVHSSKNKFFALDATLSLIKLRTKMAVATERCRNKKNQKNASENQAKTQANTDPSNLNHSTEPALSPLEPYADLKREDEDAALGAPIPSSLYNMGALFFEGSLGTLPPREPEDNSIAPKPANPGRENSTDSSEYLFFRPADPLGSLAERPMSLGIDYPEGENELPKYLVLNE